MAGVLTAGGTAGGVVPVSGADTGATLVGDALFGEVLVDDVLFGGVGVSGGPCGVSCSAVGGTIIQLPKSPSPSPDPPAGAWFEADGEPGPAVELGGVAALPPPAAASFVGAFGVGGSTSRVSPQPALPLEVPPEAPTGGV